MTNMNLRTASGAAARPGEAEPCESKPRLARGTLPPTTIDIEPVQAIDSASPSAPLRGPAKPGLVIVEEPTPRMTIKPPRFTTTTPGVLHRRLPR